jgi:spermidine synthase
VFVGESPYVGRVRVVEDHRERRMLVHGETLSAYPLNGDWTRYEKEYWWHSLVEVPLPTRPRVLLVGLGGGTQIHLLKRLTRPRAIVAVERDPVVLKAAHQWFGLDDIGGVEYLCTEAQTAADSLAAVNRRFDFVMEDVDYGDGGERSVPLLRSLSQVVAPDGILVANRHRRREAKVVVKTLRPFFREVRERRVQREGENVLVVAVGARGGRRLRRRP